MPRHAPLSFAALSTLVAMITLVWSGVGICNLKAAEKKIGAEDLGPVIDPTLPYKPAVQLPAGRVATFIERLADIETADYGYSPYVSGTVFRASDSEAQLSSLVLGAPEPTPNDSFRSLVQSGAEAVPYLLAHLDDWRPTRLTIRKGGCVWNLAFVRRSRRTSTGFQGGGETELPSYTLRIGDICYVALGQVMNRSFLASFYQPTGNVYVTSPVHDPELRRSLVNALSGMTRARHREGLLRDLRYCEFRGTAAGTLERLRFYYPDAVLPALRAKFAAPRICRRRLEEVAIQSLYAASEDDLPGRLAETAALWSPAALREVVEADSEYGPWREAAARVLKSLPAAPDAEEGPVTDECLVVLLHSLDADSTDALRDDISNLFASLDSNGRLPACVDELGMAIAPHLVRFGRGDEARRWMEERLRQIEISHDGKRSGPSMKYALEKLHEPR